MKAHQVFQTDTKQGKFPFPAVGYESLGSTYCCASEQLVGNTYLTLFLVGIFINPHKGEEMEIQEQLQNVQHQNHLRQNQHTAPFRFQLLKQDSKSF